MKKLLLSFSLIAALLSPFALNAQLSVAAMSTHPNWNADSLVRNVLLGQGVEIYNVKLNNSTGVISSQNGVGTFSTGNTPTNLGISSGLVLSCSPISYLTSEGSTAEANNSSLSGDADLSTITSGSINNCMVLEFDFIPRSDSINFEYVFASKEYYGFECTNFNDVFAFYLTGVNPDGGMYTKKNIARVPNTEIPITISTVHGRHDVAHNPAAGCDTSNSQYFVNNQSHTHLKNMNGFTTVLRAEARVVPCQFYHLKMAIANVSDNAYPSCVFLKANSLSSNAMSFAFTNEANQQNADHLYEGCVATVHLSRPTPKSQATTVNVSYSGTANNGVDFTMVNPIIAFPAGETEIDLTLEPYMDGIAEGIETAIFKFSPSDGCHNSDSVQFNIIDTDPIQVFINHDSITSATTSVQLRDSIVGGMPNRNVSWRKLNDSGQPRTGDAIIVNTMPDSYWIVEVQDFCGNIALDTILVGRRANFTYILRDTFGTTPYLSRLIIHDTIICDQEPLSLFSHGADSCVWYTNFDSNPFELRDSIVTVFPHQRTKYYLRSFLRWNNQWWEDLDSVIVDVVPLPEMHLAASRERICIGSSVTLTASGSANYSWDGGQNFVTNNSMNVSPDTTTVFVVYGLTNGAECYGHDSVTIVVDTMPVIYLDEGTGVCGGEDAELNVRTVAENFSWTANPPDPTLGGQEFSSHIMVNPSSTTVYTVTASTGVCFTSSSTTVAVEPLPIAIAEVNPITVSLGNMEATFIDLSKNASSRIWEFPYGEEKYTKKATYTLPDDVDSINVRLWAFNPYKCFDTTTITVYVDHTTLWAPNAFTPEESTNQTFDVKTNDIQRYHILIYDRRGQLVFESYDPEKPWNGNAQNGKKCPQGVYSYIISCHKITHPYDQIVQRGTVLLIR